ncbi:MAG: hypothetical protein H6737_10320 [Alphaproteobacteria bacterium]|nr:hypothetical protein [Alphaproteobacteria bacterium]
MISIKRSPVPPASLSGGGYDGDDVRAQLESDFLGKCYLCERKLDGNWQIEHFRPQAGRFEHLRTEWTNLFPADSCNQNRKKWPAGERIDATTAFPSDGLLDPSDSECDVEARLVQRMDPRPVSADDLVFEFSAVDPTDLPARNTAIELSHIHDSDGQNGRTLRIALHGRWILVLHDLLALQRALNRGENPAEPVKRLRALLRATAPFTALLRGTIRAEYPDLMEHIVGR